MLSIPYILLHRLGNISSFNLQGSPAEHFIFGLKNQSSFDHDSFFGIIEALLNIHPTNPRRDVCEMRILIKEDGSNSRIVVRAYGT